MADIVVDVEKANSKELVGQGIKAYIMQDFVSAVSALSKASESLVTENGDDSLADPLADVYLYYGKALLGLSREENEALGDAIPKNKDDDDEDEEENPDEEECDEKEEKDDGKVNKEEKMEEGTDNNSEKLKEGSESKEGPSTSNNKEITTDADTSDAADDKAADNDDPSDLQVAWEVLELAKKIYQRQGDKSKKNLAETLIVLGEISLESENFEAAINDIKEGLEIQKGVFGNDSRTIAETYYKLGVAYSTNTQIDEAIQSFNESIKYLRNRISTLEKTEKEKDVAEEEIVEIKNLIPDLEEKLADMKSYKDETLKQIMLAVKDQPKSSDASSSSSSKPATDISHLVKRKRKLEEIVEESEKETEGSPAKKPPA